MKIGNLNIACVVSEMFDQNCFILWLDGRSDCLVVDPGLEPNKIVEEMQRNGLTPVAILNTHGHADHIAGNGSIKEKWPDAPLIIGKIDEPKLSDPDLNLSAPFGMSLVSPPADQTVNEGDKISYAGIDLEVYETPGHSVGHVVFVWKNDPILVINGDVLFAGSVGRTDFPDGSFEQLADAIHTKLFVLPDSTVVLTGHGPETTIGAEKRENPFVGAPAGYLA